ncbi:calcium-binding protein [Methylobacterium sp. Leaf93]|uniref:calcium-binding protein n=1 Tax=Methylobacterium sp. Leaf93 TaxID=1736249 RepID=UPI0006FD654F|nr:calcium-binding protein [Methylobacterium sp. Leaf93]KQP16549.1 hypothetical protein ASF26_01575 [Methylobacterium sp. Leaf93]
MWDTADQTLQILWAFSFFIDEREAYNRDGFGFHDTLIDIQNVVGTRFLDILVGDAGDNILEGLNGADVIRGGAGNDTSSYETSAFSVDVNLTTKVNDGGAAWGDTLESIENVRGSDDADSLTGDAKANVLEGGAEANQLFGASGSDTASYEDSLFGVTVNLTTGANTGGDAESDILTDIENLRGSRYEDVLTGDATANVLEGGAKADQFFGAGGSDTASYEHSLLGVTVDLATGSYSGGDAQGDILTSIENLTGSQNADTLTGDAVANVLAGGAGNDRLFGGEGNDTLRGDAGSDTLDVGVGDDRLVVIEAPTLVQGDAGNDKLFLQGAETFTFTDTNFKEIAAVCGCLVAGCERFRVAPHLSFAPIPYPGRITPCRAFCWHDAGRCAARPIGRDRSLTGDPSKVPADLARQRWCSSSRR